MKSALEVFKTTLKGGILFLVPITIIIYILVLIFSKLRIVLENFSSKFKLQPIVGEHIHWILILIFLVLLCYLIGLLAKTKMAKKFIAAIEDSILSNIPGYSVLKTASESVLKIGTNSDNKVVLIDSGDTKQIGFIVNTIDDNHVAVYIPDVPNPMGGTLLFVKKEMTIEINISYKAALEIIKSAGVLSSKHLADKLQ